MADSITIISSAPITAEAFADFFVGAGGELDAGKNGQGRLSDKTSHIWAFYSPDDLEEILEGGSGAIVQKLGAVPKSAIIIEIGHASEAETLALNFAIRFAEQWPSVVDDLRGHVLNLEELRANATAQRGFADGSSPKLSVGGEV